MSQVPGIYGFFKEYRYLSNFHMCPVEFEDFIYDSSEHAYNAAKYLDAIYRRKVASAPTASEAKRIGRSFPLRLNWDQIKYDIMYKIVLDKFIRNPDLRLKLLNTNGLYLEETNTWNDKYWGVCRGIGENNLGKILMKVRNELSICSF